MEACQEPWTDQAGKDSKAMEDMRNETKGLTLLDAIRNLMANLKLTADQAMVALGVPEADRGRYAARL